MSKVDNCLFLYYSQGEVAISFALHVDDSQGWIRNDLVDFFREALVTEGIKVRYFQLVKLGERCAFVGGEYITTEEGTYGNVQKFVKAKCNVIDIQNVLRVNNIDKKSITTPGTILPGSPFYAQYRNRLGVLIWVEKFRPEIFYEVSVCAGRLQVLCLDEIYYINSIITYLHASIDQLFFLPRLPAHEEVVVLGVLDASLGTRLDGSSQGARVIGISAKNSSTFAPVEFTSKKVRRKGSSSFDVECLTGVETVDASLIVGLLWEELTHGPRVSPLKKLLMRAEGLEVLDTPTPIIIDTDARDVVSRVYSLKRSLDGVSKRRRIDIADLQECLELRDITEIRHISGKSNPTDPGTKGVAKTSQQFCRLLSMLYEGTYIPDLTLLK